jgi:signal transduction histidine kinase
LLLNKNNSIKRRLFKIVGLNIFIIFFITFFAHISSIYKDKLQILNEYNKGHEKNYHKAVEEFYRFLATKDTDNFESFIYNLDNSISEGKNFLNYLERKKTTSTSVRILNTISSEKYIFKLTFTIQSSYNLVKEYKKYAQAYIETEDETFRNKLLTKMSRQETQINNILEEFYFLTDNLQNWATDLIIKLFWFLTIIASIISYKLGRDVISSIAEPIEDIKDILSKASVGNLVDIPYIEKKDEITSLYISLDKLFQNEKDIIKHSKKIINGDYSFEIRPRSKKDELSKVLASMTSTLKESEKEHTVQVWLKNGLNDLNIKVSGEQTLKGVSRKTLLFIGEYLKASSGALFIFNNAKQNLERYASYALGKNLQQTFELKEGLIGEVAFSKKQIVLKDLSNEKKHIISGTINKNPSTLYIAPLIYKDKLIGVIELTFLGELDEKKEIFINETSQIIAPALYVNLQRWELNKLLKITQSTNKKLKHQSARLEEANKYKDEFLSNITHELKTPLNSIILLSKMLWQNKSANLSNDEIKKSEIIYNAGNELLRLIEDLLNISKVEAGESALDIYTIDSSSFLQDMKDIFEPMALEKGIKLKTIDKYNRQFNTDKNKLSQIIRNFLSNAVKFTYQGSIELSIEKDLASNEEKVLFAVKDSGIGIPKEKHSLIFEAFKQADGSINKKYGGTGLGLSITKKFAELLKGTISLKSEEGIGSTFYLSIPVSDTVPSSFTKHNEHTPISISTNERQQEVIQSKKSNSPLNAMIMDSDAKTIFTVSSILENLNLITFKALDVGMAESLLSNNKIDICIIAINDSSHINFIENIKNNMMYNPTILVMKDINLTEETINSIKTNINDIINKPIDEQLFIEIIKKYI